MVAFKSQKHAFWQALVLTVIIFGAGILFGVWLESKRQAKIENLYVKSELELFDIKIQSDIFRNINVNCTTVKEENIKFANRIYEEARILDVYEGSSRLSDALKIQHKKYDLLRAQLWINSIYARKICNLSYHNVVYLYQYNEPSLDARAKQQTISKLLRELKEEKGDKVLLIPLSGDNDITSIDILEGEYNISKSELPVVLIDEKIKLTDIRMLGNMSQMLS